MHGVPYPVVDLHEDVPLYVAEYGALEALAPLDMDVEGRDADLPKYRRANVRVVFASIFPNYKIYERGRFEASYRELGRSLPTLRPSNDLIGVLDQLKILRGIARQHGIELLTSAARAREILASRDYALGFVVHLEGADALRDPWDLELLRDLGVRSLGLTWNYGNRYAASCYSARDYGLTDAGEELVKVANELGVIVDLAHASARAALEAMEVSKKPVMISHANVRRLNDHRRNVGDDVLEALARNGGVIGLSFVATFVGGDVDVRALARHIVHVVQNYGPELVAIGSDFHGLLGLPRLRGLENLGLLANLVGVLAELGLGDGVLRKLLYENALRVLEANMPASAT
ncbi:MAG: membrane dipeptidase [Desulfurococcaceae archaeon]